MDWWYFIWPPLCLTLYLLLYFWYFLRKFCNLDLEMFKVTQGHRSWCQSISHGWFPIRLLFIPSSYLSSFLKYLMCNFDDLKLGQSKFTQERYGEHTPIRELNRKQNWRACAFTTSGVTGYRTYSSSSDLSLTFQIWRKSAIGISDKLADKQTNAQVILYLSNDMHCIRQTENKYASYPDWGISPRADRRHRANGGQFVTRALRLPGQLSHW